MDEPSTAESSTAGEVGRAAAWLVEKWLRDTVIGGAVLSSLFAILAGFNGGSTAWIVVGLVVGIPGAILPFVALARHWSGPATWLVSLLFLVASVAVIVAVAA